MKPALDPNVTFSAALTTMAGEPQTWTFQAHVEFDETPPAMVEIVRAVHPATGESRDFGRFDKMGMDPADPWWAFAERFKCLTDGEPWAGDTIVSDYLGAEAERAYSAALGPDNSFDNDGDDDAPDGEDDDD